MKRIAILTLFLLSLLPVRAAEKSPFNLKGYERYMELRSDTTLQELAEDYKRKNTEYIDGSIFQVLFDEDNRSFCLTEVYIDGDKYNTRVAAILFYDEIVYDKKALKDEKLFLAGTYTYETKGNETKTVPLYFTQSYFLYLSIASIVSKYSNEDEEMESTK